MIASLVKANCPLIYIDGSFVTSKEIPGDYDLCWSLTDVVEERLDPVLVDFTTVGREKMEQKYRGDIFPAELPEGGSGKLFVDFFQMDKNTGEKKGIVAIKIGGGIMIKNSKQQALTKKRISEFSDAISKLQTEEPKFSPLLAKAQIDALVYQRNELAEQAEEYGLLLAGNLAMFDVNSISDLPKALIMSRISMGLTQKDLADRLGMREQQIQRYENTEYGSASFKTLVSIVEALDLKITEDVFLPKESREKNILLSAPFIFAQK